MIRTVFLYNSYGDKSTDLIVFPTGENHIRIRGLVGCKEIILVNNNPAGDLMRLGMAVDICRRAEVEHITVHMPFVPYARQDQVYVEGDPLSIKVFANFLNSLKVDKVIIGDPHSKVTPALIDNVQVIPQLAGALPAMLIAQVDAGDNPFAIVAPDLGAAKKVKDLQAKYSHQYDEVVPIIQCDKTRDPETGKISGFKILDGDPRGHHCLIVDDICDGGGTFLGIYDVLKKYGACTQSLYVTHGIFSKGTAVLYSKFFRLITTDSLPKQEYTTIVTLDTGDIF